MQNQSITDNMIEEIDNLFNTINDIDNNIKVMFEEVLKNYEDAVKLTKNIYNNKSEKNIIRANRITNIEKNKKEYIAKRYIK